MPIWAILMFSLVVSVVPWYWGMKYVVEKTFCEPYAKYTYTS